VADGAIETLIVALTAEKYLFIPKQRIPLNDQFYENRGLIVKSSQRNSKAY
jgi:hypothetical protein